MKLIIDNKEYFLNVEKAIEFGALVEPKKYNIEMTASEVETLFFVLSRIGGDPKETPRGHIDNFLKKLNNLKLPATKMHYSFKLESADGNNSSLYFEKIS